MMMVMGNLQSVFEYMLLIYFDYCHRRIQGWALLFSTCKIIRDKKGVGTQDKLIQNRHNQNPLNKYKFDRSTNRPNMSSRKRTVHLPLLECLRDLCGVHAREQPLLTAPQRRQVYALAVGHLQGIGTLGG